MSELATALVFWPCAALMLVTAIYVFRTSSMARAGLLLLAALAIEGLVFLALSSEFLGVLQLLMMSGEMVTMVFFMVMFMPDPGGLMGMDMTHEKRRSATVATGALSGLLGGSTGLSGPPVLFLYLSGAEPVARMRASFIVFFAWVDVVALTAFAVSGALGGDALALAAALAAPYLLAALTGARVFEGTGEALYRRIALAVLVAVAVVSLPR